jgi:glycosyltransferase involved in cell wall biosynthesis
MGNVEPKKKYGSIGKILLITYFFPPLNNISSMRTFAFARYLTAEGFDVTVLTVPKDRSGDKGQKVSNYHDKFKVVEAAGLNPVSQINLLKYQEKNSSKNFLTYLQRIKVYLLANLFSSLDFWLLKGQRSANKLVADNHFDIVLSSHSPISTHLIAWMLKRKHPNLYWIADYRDLWSYNHFGNTPKFPFSILQHVLERKLNRTADLLCTVSTPLQELLEKKYGKKTLVVENGYFPEDCNLVNETTQDFSKKIIFTYTGVFYPEKYNPSLFFTCLKEIIESQKITASEVEVLFYGINSTCLLPFVEVSGLPFSMVKLLPQISRNQALRAQQESTALLFFGHDTPATKGVLTGKLFEYMISGKPIIACGIGIGNMAGQLINETNTGYVCGDDKNKINHALLSILNQEELSPDHEKISLYRRDRLVGKLANYIKKVMSDKGYAD